MHKALHPRNDVDIIEKNEREFASIQRSRLCGERDEKINLINKRMQQTCTGKSIRLDMTGWQR